VDGVFKPDTDPEKLPIEKSGKVKIREKRMPEIKKRWR
jgi:hypothetical protein